MLARRGGRCADCPVVEALEVLRRLFATDPTWEPKEVLAAIMRARDEEEEASSAA